MGVVTGVCAECGLLTYQRVARCLLARTLHGQDVTAPSAAVVAPGAGSSAPTASATAAAVSSSSTPLPMATPEGGSSLSAASVWNKAGTFEERDLSAWFKGRVKEALVSPAQTLDIGMATRDASQLPPPPSSESSTATTTTIVYHHPIIACCRWCDRVTLGLFFFAIMVAVDAGIGELVVSTLDGYEGSASIMILRGKPRKIFDVKFKVRCAPAPFLRSTLAQCWRSMSPGHVVVSSGGRGAAHAWGRGRCGGQGA